jgi:TolB-like protein/Tfp pilus assembly protein PilF
VNADEELTMGNRSFVFRFTDFEVREREFGLIKDGEVLPVEPKAFRVLLFLLRNPQKLITKDELLNAVWGDTAVSENSLARSIALLRRLLGDDPRDPRFIATVPTVGYRFLCPVDMSEESLIGHSPPDLLQTVKGTAEEEAKKGAAPVSEFLDSIAVLPFENAGDDPDMDYLSDGITASIINNLSKVHRLRVVPRTTVWRYKGRLSNPAQSGRELRARVVLTGRVSQRGDTLTINVEMIDTVHESQLWGMHFNRNSEDIFPIQAEIAAQVTNQLTLRLNDEEKEQIAKRPTANREAYHLLLKSVYWANKWTPDGMRKGVDYALQAIDADPVYAEAWTALAYLFVVIGFFGGAASGEMFARAKAAAVKALDIDDNQSDAHATLAYVQLTFDWDWQGSRREWSRAIELGPNLANGHWVASHWYLTQRLYSEAMREARLALDIDPLSVQFNYQLGAIHFFAREYDQAIEVLHATNELNPTFAQSHQLLAAAYAQKGMRQHAMAEIEKRSELTKGDPRNKALWGILSAMTGNIVEARRLVEELRQELKPPHFLFAYQCAALHALLGEKDEAFACLEMARQGHAVQLAYVAIAQELESLHADPRFPEMLLSMGFPPAKNL